MARPSTGLRFCPTAFFMKRYTRYYIHIVNINVDFGNSRITNYFEVVSTAMKMTISVIEIGSL